MNETIREVWFNLGRDGNPHRYTVGVDGVTKIEKVSYSTEPYCGVEYFLVTGEHGKIAEMYDVTEVYYS